MPGAIAAIKRSGWGVVRCALLVYVKGRQRSRCLSSAAAISGQVDVALMVGIARGDAQAFKALYDRYAPAVYTLAVRMLHSPQEAEQLLTDVFFEVWSTRNRYDPQRGSPQTYL